MDFALTETDDISIRNGDFEIADNAMQDADLIIRSVPGNWLHSPITGFDIWRYLKSKVDKYRFERELKVQLEEMEGFKILELELSQTIDGGLSIDKLLLD